MERTKIPKLRNGRKRDSKICLQCNSYPAFLLHLFHTIRDGIGHTWPVDIFIVFSNTIHKTSGMHGWMLIGPLYTKNLWASFGSNWRSMYGITDLFLPEKLDR